MKNSAVIFLVLFLSASVFAQKTQTTKKPSKKPAASAKKPVSGSKKTMAATRKPVAIAKLEKPAPPLDENEEYRKASALELATERVAALRNFVADFPESGKLMEAQELIAASQVLIAEEKLLSGDMPAAVALFKQAVDDAPKPFSKDFFNESIAKIPTTLFWRGARPAAFEIAGLIEKGAGTNAPQLLEIANFYLNVEYGGEAMRVAMAAAAADPASAAAHRTIALAHRVNFDLEDSAKSYSKALELEPSSIASKRGLAEMKRALGFSDEAVVLYREIVDQDEKDIPARTGLILSLFDAGKRAEAETEMAKSLEQNPNNIILLAGSSHWYANNGEWGKAAELAQKAIDNDPRYIWSHIALGRALVGQSKPGEAERVLIKARKYGNFPTLEYEIALARMNAGFYREAVEELRKSFVIADGQVQTKLGGRITRGANSLTDLVAYERRASTFEPLATETDTNAGRLKFLLEIDKKLTEAAPDEAQIVAIADQFVRGDDSMKLHRQLYAASQLLEKKIAIPKALELTKAATGNTEAGLDLANSASAVMASELYESRTAAAGKDQFIIVPEVPRQTLSAILRGRIEELTGWALYLQGNYPEAVIRLRRAVSVLPDKSAWWRSSMWRLGSALEADGKNAEALESYIQSYKTDKPSVVKYIVVEALYKKINGGSEGLEDKIGPERVMTLTAQPQPIATPEIVVETPVQKTETSAPAIEAPQKLPSGVPVATEPPVSAKTEIIQEKLPAKIAETKAETVTEKSADTSVPSPEPESKQTLDKPAVPDPKTNEVHSSVPEIKKDEPAKTKVTIDLKTDEPLKQEPAPEIKPEENLADPAALEPKKDEPHTPEVKPTDTAKSVERPPEPKKKKIPPNLTASVPALTGQKPIFEPIIIQIPRTQIKATPKKIETDSIGETGTSRQRIIEGKEVTGQQPACSINASQETVSLINGGGSLSVLVTVEGEGDVRDVAVSSSSPKDVEVRLEPEVGDTTGRRFYVIKSISSSLGVYQVKFASVCGLKEVIVRVR